LDITRRNLLIAGGAVVVVAAGGYYFWSRDSGPALPSGGRGVTQADLLQPGPLPEMALGDPNAPVTVVEYASMTCPHCATFHVQTYPEIKKRYIDTGKVRFVFREFPLDQLAAAGFMLARCAGEDRYFPMVEALFEQQRTWAQSEDPLARLFAVARQAGFTQRTFEECLANQELLDKIATVRQRASEVYGVNSTPTFFINGKIERGDMTIEGMSKAIDSYLSEG
jgi:protein-disulfide isomerase